MWLIKSTKYHKLTAAFLAQLEGATTGDGNGLCADRGPSKYASSLHSVSSNASMRSINPCADGLNASSNISLHSVSSNVSMGSIGPSGDLSGADRYASTYASSNVSLRSVSSNASMRSESMNPDLGYSNPSATTSMHLKAPMDVGKPLISFHIFPFSDVPQHPIPSLTVLALWGTHLLLRRLVRFFNS